MSCIIKQQDIYAPVCGKDKIMKDIIEALYNGKIYPAEHSLLNNSRMRKTYKTVSEKEEIFLKSLSDYDEKLFNEYLYSRVEAEWESKFNSFKLGFILGSRFALSATEKLDYDN